MKKIKKKKDWSLGKYIKFAACSHVNQYSYI